jgi:hypothetical protein
MTTTPTASDPPVSETPRPTKPGALDQYRRWARFLFGLLAIVTGLGLVLIVAGGTLLPDRILAAWPLVAITGINVAATLVVLLALIRGLGLGAAWALHAVAPVCYVLIAFGLIRALLAFAGGELLFPLEAIGGLLVLSRPHGPELLPPASDDDRRRVTLVTGLLVFTFFAPLILERVIT